MKKAFLLSYLSFALSASLFAYDATKAEQYDAFYSQMTQKVCASSQLFISAQETMKMVQADKNYLLIDVRTDGEASVFGFGDIKALHIPIEKLFAKENLEKIPTEIPVIMVCHSGTRGTMAAVGLKQIGFKNIHVLKGGFVALAEANTPASAPQK
jgi:rhodanese-related sulfurtransferase